MNVREIMTEQVATCSADTDLATASSLMWNQDCGVLPVVSDGRLAGVITDRDICIALGTRGGLASQTRVGDVATTRVETCTPDSDLHSALGIMRRAKVRRLPVVSERGALQGIVSLNDIVLSVDRKHGAAMYEDVMNTVKAVSEHRTQKPGVKSGRTAA